MTKKKIHVAREDVKDFQVDPKQYFDSTTWLCCPHCAKIKNSKGNEILELESNLEFGFNFYGMLVTAENMTSLSDHFLLTEDNCEIIDEWRDKAEALDRIMESREETTNHGGVVLDLKDIN